MSQRGPPPYKQQPPASGEAVAALKAGEAAVRKLEAEQAEQRTKLDKDLEEARAKAMTEGVTQAHSQTVAARGSGRTAPPSPAATPAPQSPPPPESSESSGSARRPGSRANE